MNRIIDFIDNHPGAMAGLVALLGVGGFALLMVIAAECGAESRAARASACACKVAPGETVTLIRSDLRAVVLARLPPVNGCPAYQVAMQGVPIANAEVLYSDIEECSKERR